MRELLTSPTEIIYDSDHAFPIFKMTKGLMKTRKKINRKGSDIHALHENSRGPRSTHIDPLLSVLKSVADSMRLRRASNRDEKLKRVGTAKRKNNQPLSGCCGFRGSRVNTNDDD